MLEYPLFGISITRDNGGTFALGKDVLLLIMKEVNCFLLGAIDANVVKNVSAIEWHDVVPFSPFGNERNTSSYLHWVVQLPMIGVCSTVRLNA